MLDLGCGPGRPVARHMVERGLRVAGVEEGEDDAVRVVTANVDASGDVIGVGVERAAGGDVRRAGLVQLVKCSTVLSGVPESAMVVKSMPSAAACLAPKLVMLGSATLGATDVHSAIRRILQPNRHPGDANA